MENTIEINILCDGIKVGEALRDWGISTNQLLEVLRKGLVKCHGSIVTRNKRLSYGDKLTIEIEDEDTGYVPIDLNLKTLYEDQDYIAVDKPAGICVHSYTQGVNLTEGISYLFKIRGLKRKVRLVNRLDMWTSGIVLIAKNSYAQNHFDRQTARTGRSPKKEYDAIVTGVPDRKKGRLEYAFSKSEGGIYIPDSSGKNTITEYSLALSDGRLSLLRVTLNTGRTHQIRAALSAFGMPILGDVLYGGELSLIQRQALHASKLEFQNLRELKQVRINSKVPEDMRKITSMLLPKSP